MSTPISFALDLLLDCETIEEVHKKCRKYIKYLESKESSLHKPFVSFGPVTSAPQQAPSTQALLERQGLSAPISQPIKTPPAGTIVSNGDGTSGKKKW